MHIEKEAEVGKLDARSGAIGYCGTRDEILEPNERSFCAGLLRKAIVV